MMQIVYFSEKDQLLAEIRGQATGKIFVTPSPLKADNLRSQLGSDANQDVITISKFTGDLLKTLWPVESERPVMKRKSELLLIFGILKNKFFPKLGYEQFTQAYNLFSDLRSYSLNLEALAPVLDEQPQDIQNAVRMFWQVLGAMGLLDEHEAYHAISEELRTHEEEPALKKTFIFWGFQHLNGQQVDLIKSLAIRYQVIIPFPLEIKDLIKRSDWISWILDHKVEETHLSVIGKVPTAEWLMVNSREMARYLKDAEIGSQIVLGVSKLTSHHVDMLPVNQVTFKVNHDLLKSELIEVSHELIEQQPKDLSHWILESQSKILSEKSASSYKKLKVLQLYQEALAAITDITDEKLITDAFFLKLLKEVVSLNLPRTSFVGSFEGPSTLELMDMSMLEAVDRTKKVILCIDDRFDDFQGLGQSYTESIQRILASLGPIKRNELELLFKRTELVDLFSKSKVLVLMPEAVTKHSLVWKKVFAGISLNKIETSLSVNLRKPFDYFAGTEKKVFSENLSASKLQTFHDCPRKFYYQFVERIFPDVVLVSDIDNKISGTLVHKMIEIFFERNLTEDKLPSIVKEVFDQEINKASLNISPEAYADRITTFNHRAANGIGFLRNLEARSGQKITWKIEQKFDYTEKYQVKGSIDCVGMSDTHVWLLDFKSTVGSTATNTDVSSIDSLQLWVYSIAAEKVIPNTSGKSMIHGFIVLDEPMKSNIFFQDPDLLNLMKKDKFLAPTTWEDEYPSQLQMAKEKIDVLALNIAQERKFPSKPRTPDACKFCELASVCTKGEEMNV